MATLIKFNQLKYDCFALGLWKRVRYWTKSCLLLGHSGFNWWFSFARKEQVRIMIHTLFLIIGVSLQTINILIGKFAKNILIYTQADYLLTYVQLISN